MGYRGKLDESHQYELNGVKEISSELTGESLFA